MSDAKHHKPVTETRIPGTEVPDISGAHHDGSDDGRRGKQWMARVAVSTAVMAAIAAISSSQAMGHLNKAMLERIEAADQWSFYQAKGIKHAVLDSRIEAAKAIRQEVAEADLQKLGRYDSEQKEIKEKATYHESLSEGHLRHYDHLSHSAMAAQVGIALAATALLLRSNTIWGIALVGGVVGAVFLVLGLIG
jgi:hypothetical protein